MGRGHAWGWGKDWARDSDGVSEDRKGMPCAGREEGRSGTWAGGRIADSAAAVGDQQGAGEDGYSGASDSQTVKVWRVLSTALDGEIVTHGRGGMAWREGSLTGRVYRCWGGGRPELKNESQAMCLTYCRIVCLLCEPSKTLWTGHCILSQRKAPMAMSLKSFLF